MFCRFPGLRTIPSNDLFKKPSFQNSSPTVTFRGSGFVCCRSVLEGFVSFLGSPPPVVWFALVEKNRVVLYSRGVASLGRVGWCMGPWGLGRAWSSVWPLPFLEFLGRPLGLVWVLVCRRRRLVLALVLLCFSRGSVRLFVGLLRLGRSSRRRSS